MAKTLSFTGERLIPGDPASAAMFPEHLARYRFAQAFVKGRRVLDAACGVGYGTALLAEGGSTTAVGIDVDQASIEFARQHYGENGGLRYVTGDVTTLRGLAGQRFDLCVSFETIEHLVEPERFLIALRTVLQPDGHLLISTPNRYLYSPLNRDGHRPWNPFHRIEWTMPEFLSLLSRHFAVLSVYGQVLWPLHKAVWFHWRARTKQLLRAVPLLVSTYRQLRDRSADAQAGAGQQRLQEQPQGHRDDQRVREALRVQARPFRRREVPLYLICLCQNNS